MAWLTAVLMFRVWKIGVGGHHETGELPGVAEITITHPLPASKQTTPKLVDVLPNLGLMGWGPFPRVVLQPGCSLDHRSLGRRSNKCRLMRVEGQDNQTACMLNFHLVHKPVRTPPELQSGHCIVFILRSLIIRVCWHVYIRSFQGSALLDTDSE